MARVLVVEDDHDTRQMFTAALRMSGFDVRGASDGFSALQQLEQELPSALVVEVAATFSPGGARPVAPGPLPDPVAGFLRAMARAETLTFQAADQRDRGALADAIRALPLGIPETHVHELVALAQRTEAA